MYYWLTGAIIVMVFIIYIKVKTYTDYQEHYIEDLETRLVKNDRKHNNEMMDLLNELKEAQSEAVILSTHDSKIRNIINSNMEKYARDGWRITKRELELDSQSH